MSPGSSPARDFPIRVPSSAPPAVYQNCRVAKAATCISSLLRLRAKRRLTQPQLRFRYWRLSRPSSQIRLLAPDGLVLILDNLELAQGAALARLDHLEALLVFADIFGTRHIPDKAFVTQVGANALQVVDQRAAVAHLESEVLAVLGMRADNVTLHHAHIS